MATRTRSNLRAAKAISRRVRLSGEGNPTLEAVLTLAETLADEIDCSKGGQKPGYVLGRLCSSYAGVLQLVTQLLAPDDEPADAFARFLDGLGPSATGASDAFTASYHTAEGL